MHKECREKSHLLDTEAVVQRCSTFSKKALAQVFSCGFCEISKNNLFTSQNTSDGCFCRCLKIHFSSDTARSSRSQIFFKISVLINFVTFTRKRLYCSLILVKLQALTLLKRLQHSCLPVSIEKFLRTTFFTEHLWWLLL